MSLWNLIRDWFVQYIWGGALSNGDIIYSNVIGNAYIYNYDEGSYNDLMVTSWDYFSFKTPFDIVDGEIHYSTFVISFGDWLSTTSTIIVLILLLIAFGYLIVNLFKMFSNIFSLKR